MADSIRKLGLRLRLDTSSRSIREEFESLPDFLRFLHELEDDLDVDLVEVFGATEEDRVAAAQVLAGTLARLGADVFRSALEELPTRERAVLSGV